jgi:hypothetical protein
MKNIGKMFEKYKNEHPAVGRMFKWFGVCSLWAVH